MPNIAIVDDREELRTTLQRRLNSYLKDNWKSIAIDPLAEINDYFSWITENDIAVLLLDEKLNEAADHCGYNGHELVELLRKHLPTFPIFIITSFPDDEDLKEKFKDVEEIIARDVFCKNPENYTPRIIRSAQKYFESFQTELAALSDLSKLMAEGKADEGQMKTLKALQAKLGFAFPTDLFSTRDEWLKGFSGQLDKLRVLADEIDHYMKSEK